MQAPTQAAYTTLGNRMEDVLFGGQRTKTPTHAAAPRTSGGMRVAQKKRMPRMAPDEEAPAVLPNDKLAENTVKMEGDVKLFMPRRTLETKRAKILRNQTPKHDLRSFSFKPNVRCERLVQPRPGF